jgi:hypothetical protein
MIETITRRLPEVLPEIVRLISGEAEHQEQNKAEPGLIVHNGITCDGCKKYPLTGIRYKCATCVDFDFCE